jgi:hypothetical protein
LLPAPPRHDARRPWSGRLLASALVAAALLASSSSRALEVEIDAPREDGGYVWSDIHLTDVISTRIEQSLSRGMPATLRVQTELWRRRTGWFDRLETSFDAPIKIRYQVWSKLYRIEPKGMAPVSVSTLDSVRTILERPFRLPIGRVGLLRPGVSYYALVSVTLEPLSVEDIEEGEGWLSGEVENKRRAGVGILTAIPRSVFDAVRNFAGFGDERARAFSEDFRLESLFPGS